jgi:hypothetical protein
MEPGHSIFVPLGELPSRSCTNLKLRTNLAQYPSILDEPSVCSH